MRLPPLNALRAFEAAARHNGYIAAAEELCVTRGAVSRHIKLLEEHLGVALFHRNHRGVDLTAAGRQLLPVLTEAFARIGREAEQISSMTQDIRIICPPALSIRWLFPRLENFQAAHPGIRVRMTTEFYGAKGFDGTEYDLGVSVEHVHGRPAGITSMPLFPMVLSPACSPALLRQQSLRTPSDLARMVLLHESPQRRDWAHWLASFGIRGIDAASGPTFPNLDMAARAAAMGSGVVMADLALCHEELRNGALVLPFPEMTCVTPQGGYVLIGMRDRWDEPHLRAFREWVAQDCADLMPDLGA
ncbi:LysR family transcriptional regulator [Ruegeria pomeroyi]|uniref:LysR substrate-binding domain-containing protein n=1 Tax=Ruegeria pomeroyi TaxID=89184 RepID=UPI001F195F98|nr:LysR substrate-binding domain-containing protein [Ruegeria pomeroyi]MCE8507335.1 LysR family transcriptional regulator [Ruegeria pomeroyi]